MEPREHEEHSGGDSGRSDPESAARVIETNDPAIVSGKGHSVAADTANRSGSSSSSSKPRAGDHSPQKPQAQGSSGGGRLISLLLAALVGAAAGAWGYSRYQESEAAKSKDAKSEAAESATRKPNAEVTKKEPAAPKRTLAQAELALKTTTIEAQKLRMSLNEAKRSDEESRAILGFLEKTLLAAGHPGNESLEDAFWAEAAGGKEKDLSLKKAVDLTESRVNESFADRPMAEALVREMLGLSYLGLGAPKQAVGQYARALALREAIQGANQPETAECRNQLAVANRLAGRTAEAARLFDRNPSSPDHASALAVRGSVLLAEKKPAEAELKLRELLTIRQKNQPDDWSTFDARSMLGEALAAQKKFAEAEPLLVEGFEGMKKRQATIPAAEKDHLKRGLERLVSLYEAGGKADEAKRWKAELEAMQAARKP